MRLELQVPLQAPTTILGQTPNNQSHHHQIPQYGIQTPNSEDGSSSTDSLMDEDSNTTYIDQLLNYTPQSCEYTQCSQAKTPTSIHSEEQLQLEEFIVRNYQNVEQDNITRTKMLNQATSILGISMFELRLLKYFDAACISIFSHDIITPVHDAWKYKVPHLFFQSDLVRQLIFSFAAMGLSTAMDLEFVQFTDNYTYIEYDPIQEEDKKKKKEEEAKEEIEKRHIQTTTTSASTQMYFQPSKYFLQTISKTRDVINNAQVVHNGGFLSQSIAKELAVSSILTYSFLGLQPHHLIKLINFDKLNYEEPDMISIAYGSRETLGKCEPTIVNSDIGGLLFFPSYNGRSGPLLKDCDFPIIKDLVHGLYETMDAGDITPETSHDMCFLHVQIQCLSHTMFGVQQYGFPLPLFRYLMILTEEFKIMLYAKHPYALRILYVYSCLNAIAGFHFNKYHSIWRDYIQWYADQVANRVDANKWVWYEMDECLYELVMKRYYTMLDFSNFSYFDPKISLCQIKEYGKE